MNYFQVLSIVFGAILILTRPIIQFFPEQWNKFELDTAYTKRQPRWVWVVGFIGVLLVAFTWYMYFTIDVPYSLIITILFSLTLIKMSQVLFNYNQFRAFAERVLKRDRKILALINTFALVLGLGSLILGIFIY